MTQAVTATKVTFTLPLAAGAAVPWRYLAASHHRGYFLNATGEIIRDLDAGADFIVTPEGDVAANAGEVALLDAPPNDAVQFRLERMTPATQGYVSTPGAEGVENSMDRGIMATQEALRDLGGTLRVYGLDQRPVALQEGEVPIFENGRFARGPRASDITAAQGYAERAEDAASIVETHAAPFLALHTLKTFNTNMGGAVENAARFTEGCLEAASSGLPFKIYGGGTVPMGAKMHLPPGGNFIIDADPAKIFMPTFASSLGFLGPQDRSVIVPKVRISGITIAPDEDIATGRPYAGNGMIGMFEDGYFAGIWLPHYSGDQGFLVGGRRTVWEDCYGFCDDPFTANGLFRLFWGDRVSIINLRGICGDDGFMAVPIEAATSPFFNLPIRDCYYIGGDVKSNHARGIAVITAAGVTAPIENMHFKKVMAQGGFEQMVIRGLNGLIRGVTVEASFNAKDDRLTFERRSAVLVQGNVHDSTIDAGLHNVQGQVLRVSKYDRLDEFGAIIETYVPKGNDITLRSHDTPAQNFITEDNAGPIAPVTYPTVEISDGVNNRLDLDIQCHELEDGIVVSGGQHLSLTPRVFQVPNGKVGVWVTGGLDTQLLNPESFSEAGGTGKAYKIAPGFEDEVTIHGGRHDGERLDGADLSAFFTTAEFDTAIAGQTYPIGTIANVQGLQFIYDGGTTIPARPGWAPYGPIVTPEHFGAAMDGVTNDTAAFQAAVNFNGRVVLPPGKTIRINSTITIPAGLTEFSITGGRGSKIRWAGDTIAQNMLNFFTNYSVTQLERCVLRDFEIVGSHATNLSWIASYPIAVWRTNYVFISGLNVSYSRVMGIMVRKALFASVTGCHVHHCARDGINVATCRESLIDDNFITDCDDDAIAVSNTTESWQGGHVISNNRISKCQGIRCLGINMATITGNVLKHFFAHGITLSNLAYNGTSIEGIHPTIAVTVTGNTLTDGLDRANLDGLTSTVPYITLTCDSAQPGNLTYVPGWRAQTPYGYYGNVKAEAENLATTPIAASGSINIANNTMMRTLPRTGLFSAQGFGKFWLRGGEYDYNLAAAFTSFFFKVSGYINNLTIANNICSGENTFMQIVASGGAVAPIRNAKVTGNTISDIAIRVLAVAGTTETLDMVWEGNAFDLDPHHLHSNRGATGGWLVTSQPEVLDRGGSFGLMFRNNDVKNACRFATETVEAMVNAKSIGWENNRIWGSPVASGFSTSNKGVGTMPVINGNAMVIIECDKASVDFGKITRYSPSLSAAIPTTGAYLIGEFVAKTDLVQVSSATDKRRYSVIGWYRLTTGSTHILDTDWRERRIYSEVLSGLAGYGGVVTQLTSKDTAVTLNTRSGHITLAADALAANATVEFEVNNSTVTGVTIPTAAVLSTSTAYSVVVVSYSAGRFRLAVTNRTAGSLSQAFAVGFEISIIPLT